MISNEFALTKVNLLYQKILSSRQSLGLAIFSAFLSRAHDGGYVLLALPENASLSVFDSIEWSSSKTADDQIEQLKRCGIETVVSDCVWRDVDESEDLMALSERLNADPSLALRTQIVIRACLD